MGKKYSYEEVKKVFKDSECELLEEEYRDNNTKMEYRCSCGNISETTLQNFRRRIKKGRGCQKCSHDSCKGFRKRLLLSDVKKFFENNGCVLLSGSYKSNREKLKYICECGNISEVSFSNFRNGQRCNKCRLNLLSEKFSHSYEYVRDYFDKKGCTLLDKKYVNSGCRMNYVCSCGDKTVATFDSFKNGSRCKKCGIKKRSGKNAYQWNPNLTNEDRKDRRLIPGYKQWIKDIYKKDNWTCQYCGDNRKLNAHHIKNYADYKEYRQDINNGITFCKQCHIDFHAIYGNKNTNSSQLHQFLKKSI